MTDDAPGTSEAPAQQAAPAPAVRSYRCPKGSYTITEGMCQARQASSFHLCPRCKDRAPLRSPLLPEPSPN